MPSFEFEQRGQNGMVFSTARSRLAQAMEATHPERPKPTFAESAASLNKYTESAGIDNPYGVGLAAYEPNTTIFTDYKRAYDATQASKEEAELREPTYTDVDFTPSEPEGSVQASGKVGTLISSALDLANRRVPYVWGGTSRNGVDCSGLIYYAMKQAGLNVPRLRAIDYGKMGTAVTRDQARPGDLVYWDNPNTTTDHIGIYLGNGKVVQAPQSGDVVKVSQVWNNPPAQYRRVFSDDQFSQVATPDGGSYWGYGTRQQTWGNAPVTPTPKPNTVTRTVNPAWRRGLFA